MQPVSRPERARLGELRDVALLRELLQLRLMRSHRCPVLRIEAVDLRAEGNVCEASLATAAASWLPRLTGAKRVVIGQA